MKLDGPIVLTSHTYEEWAYATAARLIRLGCSEEYARAAGQRILDRGRLPGSRDSTSEARPE